MSAPDRERNHLGAVVDKAWEAVTGHEVRGAASMMLIDAVAESADWLDWLRNHEGDEDAEYDLERNVRILGTSDYEEAVEQGLHAFENRWPGFAARARTHRARFDQALRSWDMQRENPTAPKWADAAALLDAAGLGLGLDAGVRTSPRTLKDRHAEWCRELDGRPAGQLPWWPSSFRYKMGMEGRKTLQAEIPSRKRCRKR